LTGFAFGAALGMVDPMRWLGVAVVLWLGSGCPKVDPCGEDGCGKGKACCDGRCVDVDNDKTNCGGCGVTCDVPRADNSCRGGRCQFQCQQGFGNCNGERGDGCEQALTSSAANCGLCGAACPAQHSEATCRDSRCVLGACLSGFADCDGDSTTGCETDTQSDLAHCGGCGVACAPPHVASARCEGGVCGIEACEAGRADCDEEAANGCEVSLAVDAQHCGSCEKRCGPGQQCESSRCRANELIVFGGTLNFSASTRSASVYRFDLATKLFTALSPAAPQGAPVARAQHVAVWDGPRNRMVVWSGLDGAGVPLASELWALDFSVAPPEWKLVPTTGPVPSPRSAVASAFDEMQSRLWVFGGTDAAGNGGSDFFTLDLEHDRWVQVHARNAPNAPSDRLNAMAAYDAVHQTVVLFGGNDPARRDVRELWQFDVARGAWRTPPFLNGPLGRARGAMFNGSPVIMYGGAVSLLAAPTSVLADMYALDVGQAAPWRSMAVSGLSARFNAASTTRDASLYVFGGGSISGGGQSTLADVWQFDSAVGRWVQLGFGAGVVPLGKVGASMVAR
jgi:hypothetical protein